MEGALTYDVHSEPSAKTPILPEGVAGHKILRLMASYFARLGTVVEFFPKPWGSIEKLQRIYPS